MRGLPFVLVGGNVPMIKAATVSTTEEFSGTVGRRLGEDLTRKLGQTPDACWLFCSPDENLAELLAGVCETVGTERLVGCTTGGEISDAGITTAGSAPSGARKFAEAPANWKSLRSASRLSSAPSNGHSGNRGG